MLQCKPPPTPTPSSNDPRGSEENLTCRCDRATLGWKICSKKGVTFAPGSQTRRTVYSSSHVTKARAELCAMTACVVHLASLLVFIVSVLCTAMGRNWFVLSAINQIPSWWVLLSTRTALYDFYGQDFSCSRSSVRFGGLRISSLPLVDDVVLFIIRW